VSVRKINYIKKKLEERFDITSVKQKQYVKRDYSIKNMLKSLSYK